MATLVRVSDPQIIRVACDGLLEFTVDAAGCFAAVEEVLGMLCPGAIDIPGDMLGVGMAWLALDETFAHPANKNEIEMSRTTGHLRAFKSSSNSERQREQYAGCYHHLYRSRHQDPIITICVRACHTRQVKLLQVEGQGLDRSSHPVPFWTR